MAPVKIAAAFNQVDALIMHSLLEAEGFHPAPLIFLSHVAFGGGEDCWFMEVPHQEVPDAKAFLRNSGHANSILEESPDTA